MSTRRKCSGGYRGRMRILVVEDEPLLAGAVAEWLRAEAHAVDVVHDGAAVSAEQLLEKAWDENADPFTNAVRITILKLRRKLGDPAVVMTEPGVGYRIP